MEESVSAMRIPGDFIFSLNQRKALPLYQEKMQEEEEKTTLATKYKMVPCPNRSCRGNACYSIKNYIENMEGGELEYDPFSNFASDSYVKLSHSKLTATCTNPKCGVNGKEWSMPLLRSICSECKDFTLVATTMCGFHNFNKSAVSDFLTGVSKYGLDILDGDLSEQYTPVIPTYIKHSNVFGEEVTPETTLLTKFAVISVCMKRYHAKFSFFCCSIKDCSNPAIQRMKKDSNTYCCPRNDHAGFYIVKEPFTGAADIGSDPCQPQQPLLKCPQCLTARPAFVNNLEGSVSSKNWMVATYICTNPRCKFMWKLEE